MPIKKKVSAAEKCCSKCESDVAALRKEIAALKSELSKRSTTGSDGRVDTLVEIHKLHQVDGLSKAERMQNYAKSEVLIKSL